MGTSYWAVEADGCFTAGLVLLTLTACSDTQFTCDSGNCVRWDEKRRNNRINTVSSSSSMEQRCDQSSDCGDQSDEAGCMLVHLNPQQYLKVAFYF